MICAKYKKAYICIYVLYVYVYDNIILLCMYKNKILGRHS